MANLTDQQIADKNALANANNLVYRPIPNNQLLPGSQPQLPQQQSDTSAADALALGTQSGTDQFQADQDRYLKAAENTEGDSNLQFLLNDYLNASSQSTGYGASQLQAEQNLGIPELQKQRATSQGLIKTGLAEYNAMKAEYEKSIADAEITAGKTGQTWNMFLGTQGAIERQKLAGLNNKAADVGILQAQDLALAGNIEAAQKTADRAIDLLYKDRESLLATKKLTYELNKDMLEKTDLKRANALTYALNKEEKNLTEAKEISKLAAQNGAGRDVLDAISKAKTYDEKVRAAGQFMAVSQNDIVKLDNGATLLVDKRTGKVIKNFGGSKPGDTGGSLVIRNVGGTPVDGYTLMAGDDPYNIAQQYGTDMAGLKALNPKITDWTKLKPGAVLNIPSKTAANKQALQTILASGKLTAQQRSDVINAVNNGEDPFNVIKNKAKEVAKAQGNDDIGKYETAKASLKDIQSSMQKFYAAGGDTSYFKGNYEKTLNRLGEVKDPNLVNLAVQIAAQLQVYRNAVSGTAYSVQEGKQIADIFPGINKSQGLNTAIMDGREKAFDSTIDNAYVSVLGNNYKQLKANNAPAIDPKQNVESYGDSHPEQRSKLIQMQNDGLTWEQINNWVKQQQ